MLVSGGIEASFVINGASCRSFKYVHSQNNASGRSREKKLEFGKDEKLETIQMKLCHFLDVTQKACAT